MTEGSRMHYPDQTDLGYCCKIPVFKNTPRRTLAHSGPGPSSVDW
jgi:hypothetical protein